MNYRHTMSTALVALSIAAPFFAIGEITPVLVPAPSGPDFRKYPIEATPVDLSTTIGISFGLTGFQKSAGEAFVESQNNPTSPNFHKWIKTSEFAKRFGAPQGDIDAITTYLTKMGFKNVKPGAGNCYISATGTLAIAAKAFNTTFVNYTRPGDMVGKGEPLNFYAPRSLVEIPPAIASKVNGVFGLDNFNIAHSAARKVSSKASSKKQSNYSYTPAQITTAYDSDALHSAVDGTGMNIAVISPTTRWSGDPAAFGKAYGIVTPTIYDLFVDYGVGTVNTNGNGEASLDIEVIMGQAPKASIFMVTAYDGLTGLLNSYSVVGNIGTIPVLTSSWGHEETPFVKAGTQGTAFANTFSNTCMVLTAGGVTLFNDAGDWAGYSSADDGSITVQLETACPYITGVGGTSLYLNSDNSYYGETLWEYSGSPTAPHGGGGGLSQLYAIPSWQNNVLSSYNTKKMRQCPDVSSNSDPATGYDVIENGQAAVYGGTSAATPLWASNVLLMDQYYGKQLGGSVFLGSINPNLYVLGNWFENTAQDAPGFPFLFNDITIGNNGVYPTETDFDLCAGWGSADFGKTLYDLAYVYKLPITACNPDYEYYAPSGWTYPVMFNTSNSAVGEPSSFVHGTTYYISVAAANIGNADGPLSAFTVTSNGTKIVSSTMPALSSDYYYNELFSYSFPAAGTYKIIYTVNTGALKESSTANNTFTRTITVK